MNTPPRPCGAFDVEARATNHEEEGDRGAEKPDAKKRRWWSFGRGGGKTAENASEHDASGADLWAKSPDSEPEDAKTSTTVLEPTGEEEKKKENQGLFSTIAGFMDRKQQQQGEPIAVEPKTPAKDDVSWTEKVLDVIVPNRQSKREEAKQERPAKDDWKQSDEEREKPPSPLERLRGIRELYQPPAKSSKDEDAEGEKSKQPGKGNAVLNLIPWLNQKSASKPDTGSKSGGSSDIFADSSTRTEDKPASLSKDAAGSDLGAKNADSAESKANDKEDESKASAADKKAETEPETAITKRKELATAGTTAVEVSSVPQKDVASIRLIFGSETFFATETVSHPGGLIFRGNLRGEPKSTLAKLEKRLAARLGDKYTLCLAEGEEDLRPVVVVVPTARDRRPPSPRQKVLALGIAALTLSTCFARGAYANLHAGVIRNAYGLPIDPGAMEMLFQRAPVSFMGVSIAVVVLIAQMVQRAVAGRRKTRVALPYLIPSYQLGSFGAVVQLSSPTPSRAALFDIAFSGALTLLVISLVLLIQGLRLSTSFPSVIPVSMSMVSSSALIGVLTRFVPQGNILVDYGKAWIGLHPLAVIGANCLTIAALNLLPIRQLDGGRIVSAIYGRKTAVFASRVTIFFLLLASAKVPYYFVFLAAVTFGPWSIDRPAKNELTEPNGIRAVLGYLLLLTMVAILLPHPASKFFGTL